MNYTEKQTDIIDLQKSFEKLNYNQKLFNDMMLMLADEIPIIKSKLSVCYENNDWSEMRKVVHSALGGLSYFEMPVIRTTLFQLQVALKSNDKNNMSIGYSKLLDLLDKAHSTCKKYNLSHQTDE